jgi:hypothetical protein
MEQFVQEYISKVHLIFFNAGVVVGCIVLGEENQVS